MGGGGGGGEGRSVSLAGSLARSLAGSLARWLAGSLCRAGWTVRTQVRTSGLRDLDHLLVDRLEVPDQLVLLRFGATGCPKLLEQMHRLLAEILALLLRFLPADRTPTGSGSGGA